MFDDIHKVVLGGISDNMASLVQSGKYVVIEIDDTTTNVFYVIQFISEVYTLQNNTKMHGIIISDGKLVVRTQYLWSMR